MRITERLRMSCKLADGLAIFSEHRFNELCDEIDAVNANLERENEELSRSSYDNYESDAIEVMSADLAKATQELDGLKATLSQYRNALMDAYAFLLVKEEDKCS